MNITENLPDLKKLQPLFRKVLGELKLKDDIFDTEYNQQGFIVEIPDEKNNFYQSRLESGLQIQYRLSTDNLYRIPSFLELWGMVDWNKIEHKTIHKTGEIWLRFQGEFHGFKSDPYTAVLKALLKQEGL